ncbi:E3 ubiquitin-protein ligase NEDD4 [Cryomyces antarcticus]
MYQTFSGSSRRPRQVNLSGRNPNPFAAVGQGTGHQQALASAHEERAQRAKQRARLEAAKHIQRVWRGAKCRTQVKEKWREEWDAKEGDGSTEDEMPYQNSVVCLQQMKLLVQFVGVRYDGDRKRVYTCCNRLMAAYRSGEVGKEGGPWPMAYLRLERLCLDVLAWLAEHWKHLGEEDIKGSQVLFQALKLLCSLEPRLTASRVSEHYYHTLALFVPIWQSSDIQKPPTAFTVALTAPLAAPVSSTPTAYASLATQLLCTYLPRDLLDTASAAIDSQRLSSAVFAVLSSVPSKEPREGQERTSYGKSQQDPLSNPHRRLALLANVIFVYRFAHSFGDPEAYSADRDFVGAVGSLLSSVSGLVEAESAHNEFFREQTDSLVDAENVGNLLSGSDEEDAMLFAGYALTLLRVFRRKGDDIRMWLYLGSNSTSSGSRGSAIRYFWNVVQHTTVYQAITKDSRAAIPSLKLQPKQDQSEWRTPSLDGTGPSTTQRPVDSAGNRITKEWEIILVFLELYTFVLKIMGDDEFFAGSENSVTTNQSTSPRTRDNTLPLTEVKDLTTFLKNLGFTMYFDMSLIIGSNVLSEGNDVGSLSKHFGRPSVLAMADENEPSKPDDDNQVSQSVAGITGMSIDYVKGLVTGVLRQIYERDSRRRFLPKEHWLMSPSRLSMEGNFIQAVVMEEESRHQIQEVSDTEGEDNPYDLDGDDDDAHEVWQPPATVRDRFRRRPNGADTERRIRQQRKASRKRYLQAVAPRLEILQNMPFLIPFDTRVQIFREFVHLDMLKRRNGYVDPDLWRQSMMFGSHHGSFGGGDGELNKHHAKIRRKHVFEDAFEQFWGLGEGLKEPIQITFVDEFDIVEAGIDGGGVTKEFLTSVTSQAFEPGPEDLFVENEQHLLYPNPALIDAIKYAYDASALDGRLVVIETCRRYEFLGRIVGKCLYEGILVDISFAGFFLLKWALTGGSGSAPRETGYRANLNDLKEMDEALYQGLLQLKNYPGDVEADFSLNFTVTDNIPLLSPPVLSGKNTPKSKTITRDLRPPSGADTPVTNANRLLYISAIARHRLQTQPHLQTTAFLKGLASIIQPSWLSMFNQSELQTLLGGTQAPLNIPDLRQHTAYGGVYAIGDDGLEHATVRMFWDVMEALEDVDRRRVLKFVTSTPRAPLLGFASLNPRFSIRDAGADEARFPTTSTCVNLLKLPMYRSKEALRDKLLYAVRSGAGFDLS